MEGKLGDELGRRGKANATRGLVKSLDLKRKRGGDTVVGNREMATGKWKRKLLV